MQAIITLPLELFNYLKDTSFERAFKLPPTDREYKEFKDRMRELEAILKNTMWE